MSEYKPISLKDFFSLAETANTFINTVKSSLDFKLISEQQIEEKLPD